VQHGLSLEITGLSVGCCMLHQKRMNVDFLRDGLDRFEVLFLKDEENAPYT
jgi:hypothetical protein